MSVDIVLQQVTRRHPGQSSPAVDDVSLRVEGGTRTALLGPSGSGKSTLLRLIAGLDAPTSGRVLIGGHDMAGVPPEKRGVGMLAQRPLLFPHLSTLDNVAFAMRATGTTRRAARDAARPFLHLVHMDAYAARNPSSLSGGQQQRVAIARTLASRPEVLLLDEPFGALDAALRDDMYALLDALDTHLPPTILLVTHDRDEAAVIADRLAVIEAGAVLQHDTVEHVYQRPASLAVVRLMGGCNTVAGIVAGGVHRSEAGAVRVDPTTPDGAGLLIIRQEAIRVSQNDESGASDIRGIVVAVDRRGPRRSATVRCGAAELTGDVPPGLDLRVGDAAAVTITPGAASVVRS